MGGDTPAAIRRAAKLADGYYPGTGDFAELQKLISDVRQAAEDNERDPAEIEINAQKKFINTIAVYQGLIIDI